MKERLPEFDLGEYGILLDQLRDVGYQFHLVSDMPLQIPSKVAYLRHDIDLHLTQVTKLAQVEAERYIQSTYYVALTLPYNIFFPKNQRILKQLISMGHEIGLHYDMTTYPIEFNEARKHLDWEIGVLSNVVGKPIRTICMHQPHLGQPDPFRSLDEFVHPHNPRLQDNLLYISDSCRAWRDETLLSCFKSEKPKQLLLTIHPELWLDGSVIDRIQYLDSVLMKNGVCQYQEYFDKTVRQVWMTHPAPKLHDERERYKADTH